METNIAKQSGPSYYPEILHFYLSFQWKIFRITYLSSIFYIHIKNMPFKLLICEFFWHASDDQVDRADTPS